MTTTKTLKTHPSESHLADYLSGSLPETERRDVESHLAGCNDCLSSVISADEAVESFNKSFGKKSGGWQFMKKINIYLALAMIAFVFSFITPRYFIQLLVATLILGIKWIVDSKTTKMLVMIYEAWKHGGEKGASKIFETFDSKKRF